MSSHVTQHQVRKAGGLDVLQFIETPVPARARTKSVKFKAIGINRAESISGPGRDAVMRPAVIQANGLAACRSVQ